MNEQALAYGGLRSLPIEVDRRFSEHFPDLHQVFLYVTDECNLRCAQCYYHVWLRKGHAEMDTDVLVSLLTAFRSHGAYKLSLLGGEPTLYGQKPGNASLSTVILAARDLGFDYVRMVTNGLFDPAILETDGLRKLDEITFSIDGDTAELHEGLRGRGTYTRTIERVKRAVALGYNVHITTCVHTGNVGVLEDGTYLLDRAITWAHSLGASLLNLHPLLLMDIPRDSWTGSSHVTPEDWQRASVHIRQGIAARRYPIPVRVPQRFIPAARFGDDPNRFGFCPVKLAERIEVHPNGQIHSCALNNGTPFALARFSRTESGLKISWSDEANELTSFPFDMSRPHPCAIMKRDYGKLAPLCISFKPEQDEYVWNREGWT